MEKTNAIIFICVLIIIVVLSLFFSSYKPTIFDTVTLFSASDSNDSSHLEKTPRKIGTIDVITGRVKNLDIENSRKS